MRYINVGTCIFCKRQEPEVTFRTRPHTIPQKMGGKNIGVDVGLCEGGDGINKVSDRYGTSSE